MNSDPRPIAQIPAGKARRVDGFNNDACDLDVVGMLVPDVKRQGDHLNIRIEARKYQG
jgi:hypothetical protein